MKLDVAMDYYDGTKFVVDGRVLKSRDAAMKYLCGPGCMETEEAASFVNGLVRGFQARVRAAN